MEINDVMKTYLEELKDYNCDVKYPGGMVLHLAPVGKTGFCIGTLTGYDEDGFKSEKAIPFSEFIEVVNEIENLIGVYGTLEFTGILAGWKAEGYLKNFLYHKKVHRVFFLEESCVLPFLKSYSHPARKRRRKNLGVDVMVNFG